MSVLEARPGASPSPSQAPSPALAGAELLVMKGITKGFPGVVALQDVDLDVRAGEVHVLFGENGAGKSTLINIIAGTNGPDEGTFHFSGVEMKGLTPYRARGLGISPVFQEFSLVPSLTVVENLFLGREMAALGLVDGRAMRRRAVELFQELGFTLDPDRETGTLSRAHQQMVEIAKALLTNVRLLILDEPTASLTERETERLFALIAKLKATGVGIIYVSHRMPEIRALADRITVLRDGRLVKTVRAADVSDNDLIELMTGRKLDVMFPHIDHKPGAIMVDVEALSVADGSVRNVNLHACRGEITGIAGLVGCGKSEVVRAVYGLAAISDGTIRIDGIPVSSPAPRESLNRGVAYFPADRGQEGLALTRPIRENASMSALDLPAFARFGVLRLAAERGAIRAAMERLKLRPPDIERAVGNLSGGNRQKVMLGRGLTRDIQVFLFDEPTVGIDVGAKREVYDFMKTLVEQGAAVVVVSSDLQEVIHLSNRVYVMHHGRIAAEFSGGDITEQNILASFFREEEQEKSAEVQP